MLIKIQSMVYSVPYYTLNCFSLFNSRKVPKHKHLQLEMLVLPTYI